jgi:hypothetical protein
MRILRDNVPGAGDLCGSPYGMVPHVCQLFPGGWIRREWAGQFKSGQETLHHDFGRLRAAPLIGVGEVVRQLARRGMFDPAPDEYAVELGAAYCKSRRRRAGTSELVSITARRAGALDALTWPPSPNDSARSARTQSSRPAREAVQDAPLPDRAVPPRSALPRPGRR